MQKRRHRPDNRHEQSVQATEMLARQPLFRCALVGLGLVAALFLFFRQPSMLGLTDVSGEAFSRFADLSMAILWDELLAAMFGHGRLETGVLDRLPILLAVVGWFAVGWWIGSPLVARALRDTQAGLLERHCLALLSGLALLSTVTFLMGLAGAIGGRIPLLLAFSLLATAAWAARRSSAPIVHNKPPPSLVVPTNQFALWLTRLMPFMTVALGGIYLLGSLMPPWEFDVLEYHLQAPKEFFQQARIDFLPHNVYANMPLGAEMHALAAMVIVGGSEGWWWGGLIGKTVIGCHSLIGATLLGSFVARYWGAWSGWAAGALMLAAPGNAHVAMAGLIDMVLATYILALLIVATRIWPTLQRGDAGWAALILVFQMAGMAAACKYPGLLFAVLPLVIGVLSVRAVWTNRSLQMRLILASAVGLSLTCVPWYLKNWWQTGNPVYPLAYRVFGGIDLDDERAAQWQAAHEVPVSESGGEYSFNSLIDAMDQLWISSPFLHPTLTFLLVCGLCVAWRSRLLNGIAWVLPWSGLGLWMVTVWWLATHRIDRFWLPVLPIWAAVGTVGATWVGSRLSSAMAASTVLLPTLYCLFLSCSGVIADNRFFVSLAALREDTGSNEFPGRVSPATVWLNERLDRGEGHVVLIGEAKVFDFAAPILYATCFDEHPAEDWFRNRSPDAVRQALEAADVRFVLINWNEIDRYRSPGNYGFSSWPTRTDIEKLVEEGVLETLTVPWDSRGLQLLKVAHELTPSSATDRLP